MAYWLQVSQWDFPWPSPSNETNVCPSSGACLFFSKHSDTKKKKKRNPLFGTHPNHPVVYSWHYSVHSSSIYWACLPVKQVAALLRLTLPASPKARSPSPGQLSTLEPFLRISPFPPPSGAGGDGKGKQAAAVRPSARGPENRLPGHHWEAVPARVCPGPGTGTFLPRQQGPGVTGLLKAPLPPALPSHLPTAWPRATGLQPYRPVSGAVGNGIRDASHRQASPS